MEERTHAPEATNRMHEATNRMHEATSRMHEATSRMHEATSMPPDPSVGAQVPLPFDDEAERPITFALTARARRTVAPDALPPLRVVPPAEVPDDDPSDTRPARARALRRAGVDLAAIAAQLGVDELLVRAWAGSVLAPRHPSRAASGPSLAPVPASVPADRETATEARAVRDAARATAARRLVTEPQLAAGLGVLAGVAELGSTAITVTTGDPRVAGSVARWLVDVLGADPTTVRLVLRVGPRAAADLARHRWGRAVGLDPDRVRTTRASATVGDADVEGVLRIVDPDLAATAAGWRDALLDGDASAGF